MAGEGKPGRAGTTSGHQAATRFAERDRDGPRDARGRALVTTDVVYLDASALVKLVVVERESAALRRYLVTRERYATSVISRVEVTRALLRRDLLAAAALDELWARVTVLTLELRTADAAARLAPPTLRSLDAIHLATALSLLPELGAFIAYDRRLTDAARDLGLAVVTPE